MTDIFSPAKRSAVMARIKGRDTAPERAVRSMLHGLGYRFRLHRSDLPGKPDIVLPRYRTLIFVHGCFWHRHRDCRFAYLPATRRSFWQKKFDQNISRDRNALRQLKKRGWRVVVVWECQLRSLRRVSNRLSTILGQAPRQKHGARRW